MHMADALLSPAVGGTMWAGTAAVLSYAGRKVRNGMDDRVVPYMGVLAAFVFAAQMINFTIPMTGSSGHLGGGLLLAILLGPHGAFLAIASVLVIQAFFFADGGLLALGSNIWNLGVYPCFLAYPLIYRPLAGTNPSSSRLTFAALVAAVAGLQLGSFSVVLETALSGVSELPFRSFLLLMQPIHLAIGVVEGLVTATVVIGIRALEPGALNAADNAGNSSSLRRPLIAFLAAAMITGGLLSWFASSHPDGLEWAIERVTGSADVGTRDSAVERAVESLQGKTAILPDYGFATTGKPGENGAEENQAGSSGLGTSVSGMVGGAIVVIFVVGAGVLLRTARFGNRRP